jgi:hypothetical protein
MMIKYLRRGEMSEDPIKQDERLQPVDKVGTKRDETPPSDKGRDGGYRRIGQGWSAWGTTLVT